jgi:hypothetical protein
MRTLIILLLFVCSISQAQVDSTSYDVLNGDTTYSSIPKWPYFKQRSPEFFGALIGGNFYSDPNIELGVIINAGDFDNIKTGGIFGPSLSYKRYTQKDISSFNFDVGLYFLGALGIGTNYTISDKGESFWGFKTFAGIALYHFQLTYCYNFFSEKNNRDMQLGHHNVSLKLAIPICRTWKGNN